MAGGDRGDNTARCQTLSLCVNALGRHDRRCPAHVPVPAADRQTDEERRLAWFTDDELAAELARRAAAADNSDGGSDA